MAQEADLSGWPADLVAVFAVLGAAMAGKRLTPELVNGWAPAWRSAVPAHTVSIRHGAAGSVDAGHYFISIDGMRWQGAEWRIRSGLLERLCRLASAPMPDNGVVQARVRIELLTAEEGGRTAPLAAGSSYRPNHNFFGADERLMVIGAINLGEGQAPGPGDVFEIEMDFLAGELFWVITPGRCWRIQEGPKLVGRGTVLQVNTPARRPS